MNSTELYQAFQYVDDRYLDAVDLTDKEDIYMIRNTKKKDMKKVALIAAVVALFAIVSTVAYAQNLWGIRELWSKTSSEHPVMPEEAATQIEQQNAVYEGDGWSCRLTETLCDAHSAMATVMVYGGDRYVVVPTDSEPTDSAASLGFEGDCTLVEYAEAQNKELLTVGAYLSCEEDIFGSGFMHFENVSDNEMVILTSSNMNSPAELDEAVCTVYANEFKVELPFSITESLSKEVGIFAPVNPNALIGISAGEAVVTETALGVHIRFPVNTADSDALSGVVIAGVEGMSGFGESGFICIDGVWYGELSYGTGKVGDVLNVSFCDLDENPIGEISFQRK